MAAKLMTRRRYRVEAWYLKFFSDFQNHCFLKFIITNTAMFFLVKELARKNVVDIENIYPGMSNKARNKKHSLLACHL